MVGQPAQLMCTAYAIPTPSITWFTSDSEEVPSYFAAVEQHDAGTYRCRGSYSFGRKYAPVEFIVLSELLMHEASNMPACVDIYCC